MPAPQSTNHGYMTLNYQDDNVLRCLGRYYYLSSRQLCRLLYSPKSLTYLQTKLKKLTEAGYCQRIWMPKRERYGSAPAVYTLARRGINYLHAAGLAEKPRYHPSEQEARSYLFLTHTLELNDFLISAELLGRWSPEFRLARMLHERDLKRRPISVFTDDGRKVTVVPDAWLDLRIQGAFQVCLVVELDRGTEEQKRWRQKVAALLAFASGPYQEAFGTTSLNIAVLTTAGPLRLRELLMWTSSELQARREESQADLFLFASIPPDAMDPERVFLTPCWFQPFKLEPIALLETPWNS